MIDADVVNLGRGFLPEQDPLDCLPAIFHAWEEVTKNLPKLLLSNQYRKSIVKLPAFAHVALQTAPEVERAMQLLSYLGHAYVWGEKECPTVLPQVLAQPWYEVSKKLGRPPVLSYASYALNNWKRLDPQGPIELGNIVLIQNFLGGVDEEWFVLVHVNIEAKAIDSLQGCLEAIKAVQADDAKALFTALSRIESSLTNICKTLERMPERCDPYIYYHRVRPYLHGWKNHPSFPHGLIYEGVAAFGEKPQQFRGETGAQSAIMPTLDGLFGITHAQDELYHYLLEMRDYMPPLHRQFVAYVEQKSKVREYVQQKIAQFPDLREVYNRCIELIEQFRTIHIGYAANYVQRQHQLSEGNPNAVGTGGTPFMQYLKKHKDETISFLL